MSAKTSIILNHRLLQLNLRNHHTSLLTHLVLVTSLVTSSVCERDQSCDVVEVREGAVRMYNGDMVCTGPQHDYGTQYFVCNNGVLTKMRCPPYLKFDTVSKSCNWGALGTCDLPKSIHIVSQAVQHNPSTPQPTTQKPKQVPTTHKSSVENQQGLFWQWPYTSRPVPVTQKPYQPPTLRPVQPNWNSWPFTYRPFGPYQPHTARPNQQKPQTQKPYFPYTQKPYRPYTQKPYEPQTQKPYEPQTPQRPYYQPYTPKPYRPITQKPYSPFRPITPKPYQPAATAKPTTHKPVTQKPTTTTTATPPPPVTHKPYTHHDIPSPALPSGPCNPDTCKLPSCFCYGDVPRKVKKSDTPQFIMLSFDDAVTPLSFQRYYLPMLIKNSKELNNPNGCAGRSTFYVSHNYTDYELVKKLYAAGHEIASHTINHRLPRGDKPSDITGMKAEIQGLKEMMLRQTKNHELYDSIRGFRAPFLRVAGNVQFDEMTADHFLYDSSITNARLQSHQLPIWPFTLDYVISRKECINPPCPTKGYPGMWEVPLNSWLGDNGFPCSMVDECTVGDNANTASEEQWYALFERNFEEHFYPNKTPMPLFMHASLFMRNNNAYRALGRFMHDILTAHDDVWMVTPKQVIEWMREQKTHQEMKSSQWGC